MHTVSVRVLVALIALALASCLAAPPPALESFPIRALSECELSGAELVRSLDVAVAIDASRSTRSPSEIDVDGDGEIGTFRRSVMTDRDDTRLTAQVVAARSLIHAAELREVRFSIVGYSGRLKRPMQQPAAGLVHWSQARIHSELTADRAALEDGLREVLENGSFGTTDFAAAIWKALRTFVEAPLPSVDARRMLLLISDRSNPLMPGYRHYVSTDPQMRNAARDAIKAGVRVHTFGVGPAGLDTPPHALKQIAGATGGRYAAVPDMAQLHCHLLMALPR